MATASLNRSWRVIGSQSVVASLAQRNLQVSEQVLTVDALNNGHASHVLSVRVMHVG
jgi:hypothetical protein